MGVSQLIERSDVISRQAYQCNHVRVYQKHRHRVCKQNGLIYHLLYYKFAIYWGQENMETRLGKAWTNRIHIFYHYMGLGKADQLKVENYIPFVFSAKVSLDNLGEHSQKCMQEEWLDQYSFFYDSYNYALQGMEKPLLDVLQALYMENSQGETLTDIQICALWNLSIKNFEILKHEALYQFAELFGAIPNQKGTFK